MVVRRSALRNIDDIGPATHRGGHTRSEPNRVRPTPSFHPRPQVRAGRCRFPLRRNESGRRIRAPGGGPEEQRKRGVGRRRPNPQPRGARGSVGHQLMRPSSREIRQGASLSPAPILQDARAPTHHRQATQRAYAPIPRGRLASCRPTAPHAPHAPRVDPRPRSSARMLLRGEPLRPGKTPHRCTGSILQQGRTHRLQIFSSHGWSTGNTQSASAVVSSSWVARQERLEPLERLFDALHRGGVGPGPPARRAGPSRSLLPARGFRPSGQRPAPASTAGRGRTSEFGEPSPNRGEPGRGGCQTRLHGHRGRRAGVYWR